MQGGKRLAPFIELLNRRMASKMSEGEGCYLVGSMPIPVRVQKMP